VKTRCAISVVVAAGACAVVSQASAEPVVRWSTTVEANEHVMNPWNSVGVPDDSAGSTVSHGLGVATYGTFAAESELDLAALGTVMGLTVEELTRFDAVVLEYNGLATLTFENSILTGDDGALSEAALISIGTETMSGPNWLSKTATAEEIDAAFGTSIRQAAAVAIVLLDFEAVDMTTDLASLTIRGGEGNNGRSGPDPIGVGILTAATVPAPGALAAFALAPVINRRRRR
jgi:hypothetical protein